MSEAGEDVRLIPMSRAQAERLRALIYRAEHTQRGYASRFLGDILTAYEARATLPSLLAILERRYQKGLLADDDELEDAYVAFREKENA